MKIITAVYKRAKFLLLGLGNGLPHRLRKIGHGVHTEVGSAELEVLSPRGQLVLRQLSAALSAERSRQA